MIVNDLKDKVLLVKELRDKKKDLNDKLKEVEACLKQAREDLHDEMAMTGLDMLRVPEVGTVTAVMKDFPSVADPDKFFPFLEGLGHGDIVKKTVHAQTLKGWYNKEGKTLIKDPEEVGLRVYSEKDITFRKGE